MKAQTTRSKTRQKPPALVPVRWTLLSQSCLDFIVRYGKEKGYPPTQREIQQALGLSSSDYAHRLLVAMELAGMIERDPGVSRGIRIPKKEA